MNNYSFPFFINKSMRFKFGDVIPADTPHAISVSIPTWQNTVEYEEGLVKLKNGYPRFVFDPLVLEVGTGIRK